MAGPTPEAAGEAAAQAAQSGQSFLFVLFVLAVCAAVAAAAIYFQRKRHAQYDIFDGLDDAYDEWHTKIETLGTDYDTVLLSNPSNRVKRAALLRRVLLLFPVIRFTTQELQRKQALYREGKLRTEDFAPIQELKQRLEDEMHDVKLAADDISPGFGDKIFELVKEFQPCQLLLVLDRNVENYNKMRDECDTELNRKVALAMWRAFPVFNYLKAIGQQIKNLEALRDQGNVEITDDDYETIMCIKDRLEEEKEAVKEEAEAIDKGYSSDVFRVVMNKANAELLQKAMQTEVWVREYDSLDKSELSRRQRIVHLLIRRFIAVWEFHLVMRRNAEQAESLHKGGELPREVYETILGVRDRTDVMVKATRAEADSVMPGMGDRLEKIWSHHQSRYKEIVELRQRVEEYSKEVKEADPARKLELLLKRRAVPAVELERKLRAEAEKAEESGEYDFIDIECYYAALEHVQEEIDAVKEEADDVEAGRGSIMIEDIERNLDEKKKAAAKEKAKERSAASQKERLQQKLQEKKSISRSGSQDLEEKRAQLEAEAERMAAELLAEEAAASGGQSRGRSGSGKKK